MSDLLEREVALLRRVREEGEVWLDVLSEQEQADVRALRRLCPPLLDSGGLLCRITRAGELELEARL